MGSAYIFLDETYFRHEGKELAAFAGVAAFRSQWSVLARRLKSLSNLREDRLRDAIAEFVVSNRLAAALAGARTTGRLGKSGTRDVFPDVGSVARRDHVWSHIMAGTVALVVRSMMSRAWDISYIRVYYDAKSLSESHREALHHVLVREVPRNARIRGRLSSLRGYRNLTVGTVRPIPKARDSKPSSLQWGVWLAHWVAKLPERPQQVSALESVPIRDLTEELEDLLVREDLH